MDRGYKPYGIIFFFVTIFLLTSMGTAKAETFCVSTAQELHDALTDAQSNGQDDVIQIVQGTYNGNFVYASTEAYNLTVEGGYTAVCASRVINPENTVLDAGGSGPVLVVSCSSPGGDDEYLVEGMTIQNGDVTNQNQHGGGLFFGVHGNVIIKNTIIRNNNSHSNYGGGGFIQGSYITLIDNVI